MQQQILEYLRRFIAFETTASNPVEAKRCLDWIDREFLSQHPIQRQHGFYGTVPYLYLEHPNPEWLFFAHIDVVPAQPEQFTLQIDGDHAIGRGVTDMKGAQLPFLCALQQALQRGFQPAISVLLTSDEEIGGDTIPHLLNAGILNAPIAMTPDSGGSPGIVVEHKGVIWADILIHSKGSHSAWPWTADNPIPLLAKVLQRIEERFPNGSPEDWQITVNPTQILGSDARNKIPATATAAIDLRYPAECLPAAKEILKEIQQFLPAGSELRIVREAPALQTDIQHPFIQKVLSVANQITGHAVPVHREHGSTDARYFAQEGIPAFLYGPTKGGGIHTADEWISIPAMIEQFAVYQSLLLH